MFRVEWAMNFAQEVSPNAESSNLHGHVDSNFAHVFSVYAVNSIRGRKECEGTKNTRPRSQCFYCGLEWNFGQKNVPELSSSGINEKSSVDGGHSFIWRLAEYVSSARSRNNRACKRVSCIFMEAHCIYYCFTVRVMRIRLPELVSSFPLGAKTNQSEVNLCLGTYFQSSMCMAVQFARGERGFCLHGKHFKIDKAL